MTLLKAGDSIDYAVTYLEMDARPATPIPHMPVGASLALIRAEAPPAEYFLYLYGHVGGPYEWTDWFRREHSEVEAFITDPATELFTLMLNGWPGGFFVLDTRSAGICDLAYFGLVPQAVGRRLGHWLLATAVHMGWDRPGVQKLTVNTNTLDHPRALGLYQRVGFVPVRREAASRILSRPREV